MSDIALHLLPIPQQLDLTGRTMTLSTEKVIVLSPELANQLIAPLEQVRQLLARRANCFWEVSTDANGFILASTSIVAGNHHDAFNLKANLQNAFKSIKRLGISIKGAYFNADSAFDTHAARKVCFNHHLIPNMAEHKHNRKRVKRGHKRLFKKIVYNRRFSSEHTFA